MTTLLKCSNGQSVQVVCQRPDKDEYQELEFSVILKTLE
jgi:preprotein translocase subunit Sss1